MSAIRKISIVGAGAMGAAYAAMFTDAVGFSVSFVARGKRYEGLKNKTFTINDKLYHVPVIHADKQVEPADLIIVALKHHHLEGAVADIAALGRIRYRYPVGDERPGKRKDHRGHLRHGQAGLRHRRGYRCRA